MKETDIVRHLIDGGSFQIGDDAAVLQNLQTAQERYVISKDLLVEGVHFKRCTSASAEPEALAHKSLHVNLSDMAAMGANPRYVLMGVALPASVSDTYIQRYLSSFQLACEQENVQLIGGDTTKSCQNMFISVTVIGVQEESCLLFRHTSRNNDDIFVAGNIGHAHIGYCALEKHNHKNIFIEFIEQFSKPNARVREGLWMAKQKGVTAMMDISDGLYTDIYNLCRASNVGAHIDLNALYYCASDKNFLSACEFLSLDPTVVQLEGGEDYSLLITLDSRHMLDIQKNFQKTFGYPLKWIGRISDKRSGITYIKNSKTYDTSKIKPFKHFE